MQLDPLIPAPNPIIPHPPDTTRSLYYLAQPEAVRIIIPGHPLGYLSMGSSGRPNKRMGKLWQWYKEVRQHATAAGLPTPWYASADAPLLIHVRPVYKNGVHSDPENTRKGFVDAVFYKTTGPGDKWVAGSHDWPAYDKSNPRCEVEIRGYVTEPSSPFFPLVTSSWGEYFVRRDELAAIGKGIARKWDNNSFKDWGKEKC